MGLIDSYTVINKGDYFGARIVKNAPKVISAGKKGVVPDIKTIVRSFI